MSCKCRVNVPILIPGRCGVNVAWSQSQILELQQSTRTIALFAEISNPVISNKSTSVHDASITHLFRSQNIQSKILNSKLSNYIKILSKRLSDAKFNRCTQRVHKPAVLLAKFSKISQSHSNFLKFCNHIKFQIQAINVNDHSVRGNSKFQ